MKHKHVAEESIIFPRDDVGVLNKGFIVYESSHRVKPWQQLPNDVLPIYLQMVLDITQKMDKKIMYVIKLFRPQND